MGSKYTEREDFLEEDNEIAGQKYVLLSFLSPEKVLADKSVFMFTNFVKDYEIQYKTKKLEGFLVEVAKGINDKLEKEAVNFEKADLSGAAALCRNSQVKVENILAELEGYVRKNLKEVQTTKIQEDYDDFLFKNQAKLEDEFYAKNNFRTTVRGLKVRGVYGHQEEAVARSKKLQRTDPIHNIFVGEVGKWLPWDPNPNAVAEQEYAEDQLNTLMKKYKENEEHREEFYKKQRKDGKKAGPDVRNMTGNSLEGGEAPDASAFGPRSTPSAGAGYESMFSGPADLALERKMKKKEEENQ
jgi:hypothetical protein